VLDVGCGSGVFLRAASDAGARVCGLDASPALIDLARSRMPEADLRLGDLQFLPYRTDAFDVVTSFNSIGFAADPIDALREAGRVAKPGAPVFALVCSRPWRPRPAWFLTAALLRGRSLCDLDYDPQVIL
jgi:ubiquinone/menaquinone biosynthesis C-methylase UbiE